MALLTIEQRQEYLQFLGYYTETDKGFPLYVDGIEGEYTKRAYKKLQDDYFFNDDDKDGLYGKYTNNLLISVYNVKKYTKNFDIKKDKMHCRCNGKYCCGFPAVINVNLLKNLQAVRDKYGATTVSSLLRCPMHNASQKGSSSTSKHMSGTACDFSNSKTKTASGRKEVINFWFTLTNPNYSYCNEYSRSKGGSIKSRNGSGMGKNVHGDVVN